MSATILYDYVEELQYARPCFRNLIGTEARRTHRFRFSQGRMICVRDDSYWLHAECRHDTEGCPILYRTSTVKGTVTTKDLDTYVKQHLVSSVIKNVLLDRDCNSDRLKGNTAVFIFYYHAFYYPFREYTLDELTDSVVIHISNTIKTMMDKELTTYRDYPEIDSLIQVMQMRLEIERSYGAVQRRINLRG